MSSERSVKDVFGLYTDENGGADGIRTHDLLDAIEARSQLRHGPTEASSMLAQAGTPDYAPSSRIHQL
jgi:hypothetical protein